jgi:hypothetical protein
MAVQRDENGRVVSGVLNPNGRPTKGQALTDVLRSKADPEEIADQLLSMARDGDLGALKYIYDRIDGKPKESRELTGSDGEPLIPDVIKVAFIDGESS